MNKATTQQIEADRALIERLGGTSVVAALLGFPRHIGPQRVNQWKSRGVPAHVRLAYPHIFLTDLHIVRPRKAAQKSEA